jgi:hypothetical protein
LVRSHPTTKMRLESLLSQAHQSPFRPHPRASKNRSKNSAHTQARSENQLIPVFTKSCEKRLRILFARPGKSKRMAAPLVQNGRRVQDPARRGVASLTNGFLCKPLTFCAAGTFCAKHAKPAKPFSLAKLVVVPLAPTQTAIRQGLV